MIKKVLKTVGLVLLVAIIIAQFFGPEKNDGDIASTDAFFADTNPPEDVKLVLTNACFDCHSNHTRYPWYNNITPVNYWLADHVKDGRKHLNFSKWDDYSDKRKDHKLEEVVEATEDGWMPLESYTYLHGDAVLSKEQAKAIEAWVKNARIKYVFMKDPQ